MGVQIEPNVSNVFAAPALIYVAPYGTAFPALTAKPAASDWATAGFRRIGYTEAGMDLTVTPETYDVKADESITALDVKIKGLKVEAKTTLMEANLENLEIAVGMSKLTNPGTGIKTLKIGSANVLQYFALGMQGGGPGGADARVFQMFRTNVTSAATISQKRADTSKVPCNFNCLADSAQSTLADVAVVTDFNAGS